MQSHLVSFEYGTGSVWGYLIAPSVGEIESRLPEVEVAPAPPAWMTNDDVATLQSQAVDVHEADSLDRLIRTDRI